MATKFDTTLLIQRMDGTTYDLGKEGIRVVTFDPPSPSFQHTYNQVGKYGAIRTNTVVQQTSIPLTFDVYAENDYDYELQRLKVLTIFDAQQPFYVINARIPYLRWKVSAEAFSYPRLGNYWKAKSISINLVCESGFAETTKTSLELFDKNSEGSGFGLGLDGDAMPEYTFKNKKQFVVNNIGRIPLLAEEHPVKILFHGIAPNGLTIKNKTTGQAFKYNKELRKVDEFVLWGLFPVVNGKQRLGSSYSSRSYLDFNMGTNKIEISGSDDFTISFETRFYY